MQSRKRRRVNEAGDDRSRGGASDSSESSEEYDEDHSLDATDRYRVVTESSLNGSLRLEDAHIIVVCSKLNAGYNEPRISVMYVDRALRGARAVQVLSRLNRRHPLKRRTLVVDFVNQAECIRDAFEEFW